MLLFLGVNGTLDLNDVLTAANDQKLRDFAFEKVNGSFVKICTDLVADDITLNGTIHVPNVAGVRPSDQFATRPKSVLLMGA